MRPPTPAPRCPALSSQRIRSAKERRAPAFLASIIAACASRAALGAAGAAVLSDGEDKAPRLPTYPYPFPDGQEAELPTYLVGFILNKA